MLLRLAIETVVLKTLLGIRVYEHVLFKRGMRSIRNKYFKGVRGGHRYLVIKKWMDSYLKG